MEGDRSIREELRALPVFSSPSPSFDYDVLPDAPSELFRTWLRAAIDAGVPEPHAMTLGTVDPEGAPDARILILKDQVGDEWHFASSATSAKGRQLQGEERATLTFYWTALGRQVRIRGRVEPLDPRSSGDDFLARGLGARAVALASEESTPLGTRDQCVEAVAEARRLVMEDQVLVPDHWTLYSLTATQVEFWQADADRLHHRVQYRLLDAVWVRGLLWP